MCSAEPVKPCTIKIDDHCGTCHRIPYPIGHQAAKAGDLFEVISVLYGLAVILAAADGEGVVILVGDQHRDLIGILPDGRRVYEFHPWEKKMMLQKIFVIPDVSILPYLEKLEARGEDPADYESIWYYY